METEDTVAVLGSIAFFAEFSIDQLRLLAFVSEWRRLMPGDLLYSAGEPADGGYVLTAGRLQALDDAAPASGYRIDPPALVGEIGLVLTRPRSATIKAATRAELLFLPRAPFLKLLRSDPALAEAVSAQIRAVLLGYLDAIDRLKPRFEER